MYASLPLCRRVCVYMRVHARASVSLWVCMDMRALYVCGWACTCVFVHVRLSVFVHVRLSVCACVCTCVGVYVWVCVYVCV